MNEESVHSNVTGTMKEKHYNSEHDLVGHMMRRSREYREKSRIISIVVMQKFALDLI